MIASVSPIIADALAAAVRAPSPYNTQPWRFEVSGTRINLLLDRGRVLPVADPDAREARLACGAALCNLRLAVRAVGRGVFVDLMPDRSRPDLLASVLIAGERPATTSERKLAEAIDRRHTNRHPFLDRQVPAQVREALAAAARAEGARMVFIDASERYDLVADLIRRAERLQEQDERYVLEFKQWTGGPIDRVDGVPIDAVGPEPLVERALTLRSFYRSSPVPPREFEQQPLIAAVLTASAGARYDLRAGVAMERALLTACDLGLSTSFLSQPFEVPETRARLAEEFRAEGEVHTLLRIGYGYPVAPTPRRSIEAVTSYRAPGSD